MNVLNVNANVQTLMFHMGNPSYQASHVITNMNTHETTFLSHITICSTTHPPIDPYVSSLPLHTQWQSLIESAVISVDLL